MVNYHLITNLGGNIAITTNYHEEKSLQGISLLYKFVWVQTGEISVEIDHIPLTIQKSEIISLTPQHHLEIKDVKGEYLVLMFNSNFYCIFGHDKEVSCNGFLFSGSSHIHKLKLSDTEASLLIETTSTFISESKVEDSLQEEMLRITLKRFIILCTRMARNHYGIGKEHENEFNLIRQFHVLVDQHFKEKKKVKDYADMLCRSPKTITNLFASCNIDSPLCVIHERIAAEAKRLLLYTDRSAKEIALILGFEDIATFSRFFKKMTGKNISEFRKEGKKE